MVPYYLNNILKINEISKLNKYSEKRKPPLV